MSRIAGGIALFGLAVACLFAGCDAFVTHLDSDADPAEVPTPAPNVWNPGEPNQLPAHKAVADVGEDATEPPAPPVPQDVSELAPPPPDDGNDEPPPVRLSTGTALAQTLPTGTAMGFSVDYRFNAGRASSSQYALVVRDAAGQTHAHLLPPGNDATGTLAFFVTTWKPNQAPFEAVMVVGNGQSAPRAVSNVVDLR